MRLAAALVPLGLLGALVVFLTALGPAGIFPGNFPPVEELTIGRVDLTPGRIELVVTNGGPEPVTVAQVLIDDAFWSHSIEPSPTILRLRSAGVTIPYPWVEGEPFEVKLVSSTGLTFSKAIDVATETPALDFRFLLTFTMLGIYIGVVPVLMGMTWMPFLRTLSPRWTHFFMAFTAGVLVFLGAEAFVEAIEGSEALPSAFGGIGVITAAAVGAFALILMGSRHLQSRTAGDARLIVAYAVAAGIGLHNAGEGLAVGSAYRLGEIALGTLLVIGFAVHNTTEGLGIVSLLGDRKTRLRTLLVLGLIAGVPTIFGAWTGAFFFSPFLATVFLAVAAGAIAEVVVDVMRVVKQDARGGLASPESLLGLASGLAVMYLTGLLVGA